MRPVFPQPARVYVESWAGTTGHDVIVIGETAKRYRVRVVQPWRMRHRRQLRTGDVVLVPKEAVTFMRRNPNVCRECAAEIGKKRGRK